MNVIEINKLTKSYGKSRGIIDLDLTVKQGEFFGFIGPNGAGKSTTIRTLLGLIKADSGSASVLGLDICKDNGEILSRIGYLPSESSFYSGMRVRDILKLSSNLHKKDYSKKAKELCDRLKLDSSRKVDELSFGNKKKVGIVCALQHSPELIILDEPTSGLDPLMQREFFEILRENNRSGATIFLSSHVLSEIQNNCTSAAIIREGKIIASDKVENLSKSKTKKVTVHGKFDCSILSGISNIHSSSNSLSFLFNGDINQLIQTLASHHIRDLAIAEPDLEEIFMHYYAEEEKVNDNNQA